MVDIRKPRRGSLAFKPRKRAKKEMPSIGYWPEVGEASILGFAGFKVGMTTVSYISNEQLTKGMEVSVGATIVEVPPMRVYGYRVYENGKCKDVLSEEKEVMKAIKAKKINKPKENVKEAKDVRLLAYTQPYLASFGKKKIERMEIGIGGEVEEKIKKAEELLGKEIGIRDVFKEGQYVDVVAITKGKGWQGPVKRFGVAKQRRKATGKVRHVGTLGPFHPNYVMYTVPMPGQMGYHKRTEINKLILKIGSKEELDKINPSSGFPRYGLVRNDYLLIKGSFPEAVKRLIRLRRAIRKTENEEEVKLTMISNDPKN